MAQMKITASNLSRLAAGIDRVWLAITLIFGIVIVIAPDQSTASALFTLTALINIAAVLFFAISVAAYIKATRADSLIAQAFKGRTTVMIMLAAVFGGLSPLCSCGIIPLIAALLSVGVPIPAVMAFWPVSYTHLTLPTKCSV